MTYVDDLSKWVMARDQSRQRATQGLAKVAFLAVRMDVLDGLAAGYQSKTIWRHLHEHGRYPYSYKVFRTYVVRELTEQKASPSPSPQFGMPPAHTPASSAPRSSVAPALDTSSANSSAIKSKEFVFSAVPNKKDLI